MSEFTPITSQEEFDQMIKSRLERERSTVSKQYEEKLAGYADYDDLKKSVETLTSDKAALESSAKETAKTIETLNSQLEEANAKVKAYSLDQMKATAAIEAGIPLELRNRLTGDSEEAIKEDAANLAKLLKTQNGQSVPKFEQNEGIPKDESSAVWKQMAKSLKGE